MAEQKLPKLTTTAIFCRPASKTQRLTIVSRQDDAESGAKRKWAGMTRERHPALTTAHWRCDMATGDPSTDFEEVRNARREAQDVRRAGAIYFVSFGEGLFGDGPIKIGFTCDLRARIELMQTGCPWELKVMATLAGNIGVETALHEKYARHRMRGEWFERNPMLLEEIAQIRRRGLLRGLRRSRQPAHAA